MSNSNKDDFERMMQLAEFGARRHDERRQVEFRIFIAYNTLLVLAFYQIEKIEALKALEWVIPGLVVIHIMYLLWQIRLSRALVNDGWRRNFYLKKAECILDHLRKHPNVPFSPRENVCVTIALGPELDSSSKCTEQGKIFECELFDMHEPKIALVAPMLKFWRHWSEIYTDWSRPFQIFIPTVMLDFLIIKLNKGLWGIPLTVILILFLFLLIFFDFMLLKIKKKSS